MLSFSLFSFSLAALASSARATYTIQDTLDKSNFFDEFEFYSGPDPTNGFVSYQSAASANAQSLAGYAHGGVYLGVDAKAKASSGSSSIASSSSSSGAASAGRASTRVNTKKTYNRGLFVADIAHMPASTCGVWAAYWMFGDPWPFGGEIDIIEGVNRNRSTTHTLHTSAGCTFEQGDCNAGGGTVGCPNPIDDDRTYGTGFNEAGGGVSALEWTSSALRFWFWSRTSDMPADLASDSPDPRTWGPPRAVFSGTGCDIDSHFKNQRIVFNTALCGDWAGKVFSSDPVCAAKAATCEEWVAGNPDAFSDAFWLVNSVKVYTKQSKHGKRSGGAAAAVPQKFEA